jgi:hypothetical protein
LRDDEHVKTASSVFVYATTYKLRRTGLDSRRVDRREKRARAAAARTTHAGSVERRTREAPVTSRVESRATARGRLAADVAATPTAAIDPYRLAAVGGLLVLAVLAFVLRHDVGLMMDESAQMRYGKRVLSWYTSAFQDRRALGLGWMDWYGGLFESLAQAAAYFTPLDVLATRHAAVGLCGIMGVAAAFKIASRIGGTHAGLCAAVVLAFTPTWTGHSLFNSKDIPFAAASGWVVYGMVCLASGPRVPSWRSVGLCGVAIGAALGVRPGGMFLLAYPLIAILARSALLPPLTASESAGQLPPLRAAKAVALRLLSIWAIAWSIMLIAWPWAQLSPLTRPFQAAWAAAHFPWLGKVLFDGAFVASDRLPASYLPTWFAFTLPETYLLAASCGFVVGCYALRARKLEPRAALALGCVAFAACGPLLAAMLLRPVIYDGHRHFLFLLPPTAALAGLAISAFLREQALPAVARAALLGMLVGLLAVITADEVGLHPYEYVYFNRLGGGLAAAQSRFETDYWGASYTEGLRWVEDHLAGDALTPLRISQCNHEEALRLELTQRLGARHFVEVAADEQPDLFLASTRFNCHRTEGEVLHVVARSGVPLLYVIWKGAPQQLQVALHHGRHVGP